MIDPKCGAGSKGGDGDNDPTGLRGQSVPKGEAATMDFPLRTIWELI